MKVLLIGPNLEAGGAQRQWSILAPGLRARGFDTRVIALEAGGPFVAPLRLHGVPVAVVGMRHRADLRRVVRCPLISEFVPDVIVSRGVNGLYVGHFLSVRHRAGHVYNDHVGVPLSARRETMIRLIASWLRLVIAVSPEQRATWVSRGLRPERFVIVANGVETPDVPEQRDELRRELGIEPSQVVALLVASLRPEKRVPDFVEAIRRARAMRPELVGVIVGEGAERASVERAINGDPGLRLLGHRDDVPQLLKASDVFALSSEYEAAPMSILEAMASGLPVVATNVGGVSTLVHHQQTGVLVPPRDPDAMAGQLAALAADVQRRRSLGSAGLRHQRQGWSAAAMVDRYATLLTSTRDRA